VKQELGGVAALSRIGSDFALMMEPSGRVLGELSRTILAVLRKVDKLRRQVRH
jgi:hypothetical protein